MISVPRFLNVKGFDPSLRNVLIVLSSVLKYTVSPKTMPIIALPAKIPSPPKKRRNAIGPNSKNRSSKRRGSDFAATLARVLVDVFGRRNRDALAAAAGRRLVGIVEHEAGAELLAHEIHFRADQEEDRFRFDEDFHTLVLDHLVERFDIFGVIHRVGHAGAAAVGHADAHALILAVGVGHDV